MFDFADSNLDIAQNTLLFKNLNSKEVIISFSPKMFKEFLLDYQVREIRENFRSRMSARIQVSDSVYTTSHSVFWGSTVPSMLQKDKISTQNEFKTSNYVIWLFNKINTAR